MLIDSENKDIEVFFFDDHIKPGELSIVDCRDIYSGKSIDNENFYNKYLIKVDTLKAAEDENYFWDIIKKAEN